jgi:hypothetical protein
MGPDRRTAAAGDGGIDVGGDPDERPHPDGGVDDFDAIVASWRRDGEVPRWPESHGTESQAPESQGPAPDEPGAPWRVAPDAASGSTSPLDEHFVPPEPPPLPRLAPPVAVGLVLLVLGVVLVSTPAWIGVPDAYGLPLGLLTLAAGLGWLVLRLWPAPPGADDDDGAVL